MSAGLSNVGTCFQDMVFVNFRISKTRFTTNVFSQYDCMLIHCNVIDESDHKYISSNLSDVVFRIDFTSHNNSKATHSSSLDSEIVFSGATRFFEHNRFVRISTV
jgi:hypothetical protein